MHSCSTTTRTRCIFLSDGTRDLTIKSGDNFERVALVKVAQAATDLKSLNHFTMITILPAVTGLNPVCVFAFTLSFIYLFVFLIKGYSAYRDDLWLKIMFLTLFLFPHGVFLRLAQYRLSLFSLVLDLQPCRSVKGMNSNDTFL